MPTIPRTIKNWTMVILTLRDLSLTCRLPISWLQGPPTTLVLTGTRITEISAVFLGGLNVEGEPAGCYMPAIPPCHLKLRSGMCVNRGAKPEAGSAPGENAIVAHSVAYPGAAA